MQQVRQTPIFESSENIKSLFDYTQEADEASSRYDQLARESSAAKTEAIGYERENRAIQRKATADAYESIGDLQAKAHFNHQEVVDKSIVDARDWVANYKGDRTSPEFLSGLNRRVGAIKSYNAQSKGLVDMIPELKKRAESEEYDTGSIMKQVQDLAYDPKALSSPFASINEAIDNIFYNNLDENMIIKKAMKEQYGDHVIARAYTDEEGASSSKEYALADVFSGFDKDGNLIADRDKIDLNHWKQNYPQVVQKIKDDLNDPNTIPQVVKSASTMTEDDMIREEIAKRMERLGQGQLSTKVAKASIYDQAKLEKGSGGSSKVPIDYNAQYNKFVQGLLSGNYADASQAVAKQDKQNLRFVTKAGMLKTLYQKRDAGAITSREVKAIENQYKGMESGDYVALRAGNQIYPPTQDGIKQSFIALGSENFSTRDDRVNLSTADLFLDDRVDKDLLNPITNEDGGLKQDDSWNMIKEILSNSPKEDKSSNQEKVTTLQAVKDQYGDDFEEGLELLKANGWTIKD